MSSSMSLDKITSLCKRRGFMFQSAEIYGGLNGVYDTGPLGTLLKQNIRSLWTKDTQTAKDAILFMEGSILGPQAMWVASGHVENFHDPMVDCQTCKHRYRADDINLEKPCPNCGTTAWTSVRQFNMMFSTHVGATQEQASIAYLRPETAQSIFVNFKNILSTMRIKIPFGIAQIGKAFRNEITPKQFVFRMREFEQMELEWFCHEKNTKEDFEFWVNRRFLFYKKIGIQEKNLRVRKHKKDELSHYSQYTSDIEYNFPFGWKELEGIAYRGNFDLSQHTQHSGKDLSVFDEKTQTSYIPHVVESSVGVDRIFLMLLSDAYDEDIADNEQRIVLRLSPQMAPYKAAFLPLTKKQVEPMHALYKSIQKLGIHVQFDVSGSIGKRYRRQDEIGTPVCFTYDFDSQTDYCITVRDRDTMKQERIAIDRVKEYLIKLLGIHCL